MSNIWLTSDTHFCHDRDFVWGARGFKNVHEMNEAIIEKWNKVVRKDDIVYHLGDVMLMDNITGLKLLRQLNGTIYIALGNHDTDSRVCQYKNCYNVTDIQFGYRVAGPGKKTLVLTHYPTITANGEDTRTLNLFGHTHQKTNFFKNEDGTERKYMYHVGMDSHDCTPVNLEDILAEIAKANK